MFGKSHYHIEKKEESKDRFYLGLFVGVAVGAGLYWLFKSDSGKKVRQALMDSEQDWAKEIKDLLAESNVTEFFEDEDQDEVSVPQRTSPEPSFVARTTPVSRTASSIKRRFFKIKR
ncbi:MAG: hypothetical protein A3F33_02795 [Candidatus Woykebacteria bacterium RIFCSPHIGHO2_12_FULL_43_10]|uniref:YtxH domain-containing protein n=2 Tax=Candidatus Woykeibacteriota TaxID=1817899 RepID=A0A1G1WXE1_9BACT|nr:MAG: hypothetical protein A2802_02310 [Candidatus Woykebacteria bacterium RIFCSPHIGHO2_01_FULL_43_29]OGY28676.1 MAG: hypothetical protein A3J50_01000 [Candidatus Woykebacteria bacterium RIFCSPHIGHO2_02_FULL_43_16b]OGY29753.1 MAG: hypothetical protein A3F33_02795 [Candidatus Woykebacteria bacterium RIFCSPHIGHO2_12_FULL_43_10]OGY32426.1 MAG: hypothetical protein A3A61_00525 [Candidatus Woykebacteria bacterium RIFCSPLOWO2_01_FULL_43_14]